MTLLHLRLVGTPYERGCQHGEELRDEIQGLYERWLACADRQAPRIDEEELLAFTGEHVEPARRYVPHWVREVEGIGESSGLGFDRAFALSCWDELCSWFSVRSEVASGGGCTSLALTPPEATTTIIAQNQDAWGWWRPVVVLEEYDDEEHSRGAIYAAHPGVLGTLGVNNRGVGLVANSLIPSDRGVGVPFALVMREVLQQSTLADAMGIVLQAPRATGANYVIATSEAAVDIEAAHAEAVVTSVAGSYCHSNHYLSARLSSLDVGGPLLPDSYLREARMRRLMGERAEKHDVERALDALCDHECGPTSICRHPTGLTDEMETLGASVIVPAECALYITDGLPCSNEPSRFEVAKPIVLENLQSTSCGTSDSEGPSPQELVS